MSKPPAKKPNEASGQSENASVFDFLYHDPLRIASFLGQFDPHGVAQSLKRTDQTTKGSTDQSNDRLRINVGVASGQLGEQIGFSESAQHGSEKTYDPLWANARAFLDYLETHAMIERHISQASIGNFVLFSGKLSIADLTLLREAWKLPSMKKALGIDERPAAKYGNASAKTNSDADAQRFAIEMLSILPHSVQATLSFAGETVWANLKPDCLASEPSDLTLKHGFAIPGDWSVIGILDARPRYVDFQLPMAARDDGEEAANVIFQSLAPLTRKFVGRPDAAYAVTPLLLFRQVGSPS